MIADLADFYPYYDDVCWIFRGDPRRGSRCFIVNAHGRAIPTSHLFGGASKVSGWQCAKRSDTKRGFKDTVHKVKLNMRQN